MMVFFELIKANIKETVRDKMAAFWYLAFPVFFILLFGMIFSGNNTGDQTFKVGLVKGTSTLSPVVESAFKGIRLFNVLEGSRKDELAALRKGDRSIVIIVPDEPAVKTLSPKTVRFPVYYDASQQTARQILIPVVSQVFNEIDRRMAGRPPLLAAAPTPVQASKLKDIDFLVPGIIAMAIMQLGLFGSMNIVGLREQKVLKCIGATPLPRPMFLASEIVVRLFLSLIQASIIILIGHLVFGVSIVGNWFAVYGLVILGAAAFVSMGYMLVCVAKTVESGQGIVQAVQFPMMFLSGIFFPLAMIPKFLKPVVSIMPLTYFGDALRQVMVDAGATYSLGINIAVLVGWTLVSMLIASRFWRWD